jgi:folate-binding protein YgfZ
VALIDLTGRGHIVLTGEDRARLLHAMCTNDIQSLAPGGGCYTLFLTAQGRIIGDANVLCTHDALILDTEPEAAAFLAGHLDKYVIADDCTVTDVTPHSVVFGIEGPGAEELLGKISIAPAPGPMQCSHWSLGMIGGFSATGQPGYRIYADRAEQSAVAGWLTGAGAIPANAAEARLMRVENGRPRFGEDFGERQIPHETRLLHAVSFSKGCYLGQEIVERVRSRGQVNRKLVQLVSESTVLVPPGTRLVFEDKEVGEVTSSGVSPSKGKQFALGYLRVETLEKKVPVQAGEVQFLPVDRVSE